MFFLFYIHTNYILPDNVRGKQQLVVEVKLFVILNKFVSLKRWVYIFKKPGDFRMNISMTHFRNLPLNVARNRFNVFFVVYRLPSVDFEWHCINLNLSTRVVRFSVTQINIIGNLNGIFLVFCFLNSSKKLFFKYILDVCVCRALLRFTYIVSYLDFALGTTCPVIVLKLNVTILCVF